MPWGGHQGHLRVSPERSTRGPPGRKGVDGTCAVREAGRHGCAAFPSRAGAFASFPSGGRGAVWSWGSTPRGRRTTNGGSGDVARHGERIREALSERLPKTFCGYPTHFAATGEPSIDVMQVTDGPVRHRVDVSDPGVWFTERLGFDPQGRSPRRTGWPLPLSASRRSRPVPCSTTDSAPSYRCGRPSTGTPMTSGSTCRPANGSASRRRRRSSGAAVRWATHSGPPSSPPGWCGT